MRVNQTKFRTIAKLTDMVTGLLLDTPRFRKERASLKADQLHGEDYYDLERRLHDFLIGDQGSGFIAQILTADDYEAFREIVNGYSAYPFAREVAKPSVDEIFEIAKSWLATNAWLEMQFVLNAKPDHPKGDQAGPKPEPAP